jgi:uridylate kinase
MDSTAFTLENKITSSCFWYEYQGNLLKICEGENVGTVVSI